MDIIIFAAIALFFFLKLRSQFGRVDEEQKREAIKKFLKEQADLVDAKANKELQSKELDSKKLQKVEDVSNDEGDELLKSVDEDVKKDVIEVMDKSNMSVSNFLNGANVAFEMVIEAFCKGDKATLKTLLSDELLKKFTQAIDLRSEESKSLNTKIVAIDPAKIKSAKEEKGEVVISIEFNSKQINYVESDGKVIEGSKEIINQVCDIWTFSRKVKSKNPNWVIISTKS